MFHSNWRKWLSATFLSPRRPTPFRRPRLEELENRVVPVGTRPGFTATALNPTLVEGQATTAQLATFTDTTPSPAANYAVTITWGDGTAADTTTGTVTGGGQGPNGTLPFVVNGTHTYVEEGATHPLQIVITETAGDLDTATVTGGNAIAADAALTLSPPTFRPTEGKSFSGAVATFTDGDPADVPADYVATIDWGDGTIDRNLTPTANPTGGGFSVNGTHSYADEGSNPIQVTVRDNGGATAATGFYTQANLTADVAGNAANTDANLVNPWGIAASPGGPFWVSDNGTGLSTLYNAAGVPQGLVVTVPAPANSQAKSTPTGQVFNGSTDFAVTGGPAHFIFATEDGTISGWNNGTTASLAVDHSAASAVYKGLAIGNNGTANFLYAANFRSGAVEVFDKNFAPATLAGTFTDPALPAGFAPFGIQNVGGKLFVTYAKQDEVKHDDVSGPGNGYVDVFDLNGNFLQRFASAGPLNSPWGVAQAPANFGALSNDVLVGNFGDGRINAFDPTTGNFLGQLSGANNQPIAIDGLWGLAFGNGGAAGPTNTLFFTAGTNGEADGLFGSLTAGTPTVSVLEGDALTSVATALTLNEAAAFNGRVATFTDTNAAALASDFTATINWGDGVVTPGVVNGGNGTFIVLGNNHTYADDGTFTGVVTLTEDTAVNPLTATSALTATVAEADAQAVAATVNPTEGTTLSGPVATFTDPNSKDAAGDFKASINWGDDTTTTGTVAGANGTFTVTGSHVYADEGSFPLVVTWTETTNSNPLVATSNQTVIVAEGDKLTPGAPTTIAPAAAVPITGTVATFTDVNTSAAASDFTASINWGDGTTTSGTVSVANGTLTVNGTHTYGTGGSKAGSVTLTEDTVTNPLTATSAFTANVSTRGPEVLTLNPANVKAFEFQFTTYAVASFTDTDATAPAGAFNATIFWPDGSSSAGVVTGGNGTFTISGIHEFNDEGKFTGSIRVTKGTLTATAVVPIQVAEELLPDGSVGSTNQRLVSEMYRDLLGRPVDPKGLALWTGFLDAGHSATEVANLIESDTNFSEFRFHEVELLFQRYLHRSSFGDQGAIGLVQLLQAGGTLEQVSALIVSSPEYVSLVGSSNDAFLTAVYADVLRRAVDPQGRQGFDMALAAGITKAQVAAVIFGSFEYRNDLVASYYLQLVDRPENPGEGSAAVNALTAGVLDEQLIALFVGSKEYANKTA